jgi:hypothetical protein
MPCDSVITSRVEWAENTDEATLIQALTTLGFTVNATMRDSLTFHDSNYSMTGAYDKRTHKMTVSGTSGREVEGMQAKVKVEYSKEVVNSQARRFGWSVDWKVGENGNPIATVKRRA